MSTFEKICLALVIVIGLLMVIFGGYLLTGNITKPAKEGDRRILPGADQKEPTLVKSPDKEPVTKTQPTQTPPIVETIDGQHKKGGLTGRVIGKAQQPLGGATVELYSISGPLKSVGRSVTQADGRFVFEGVSVDEGYQVQISAGGYATKIQGPLQVRPDVKSDVGALTLDAIMGIEYRVVDNAGKPLEDVKITVLLQIRHPPTPAMEQKPVMEVRTDASGRINVQGLADGIYRFEAAKPGYSMDKRGPVRIVKGQADQKNLQSILIKTPQ